MNIDAQMKLYTKSCDWLCFRHAVERATQGEDIEIEIGDYGSEYYLGTTVCVDCYKGR